MHPLVQSGIHLLTHSLAHSLIHSRARSPIKSEAGVNRSPHPIAEVVVSIFAWAVVVGDLLVVPAALAVVPA